jgi:CRP-like cAMP-binding protein
VPAYGRGKSLQALSAVPLFAGLSMGQLEHLARIADEVDLHQGKVVISEGGPSEQLCVLLSGGASVRRKGRVIATMKHGDFFGEIALLCNRPATATVTLTEDSAVLVIRRAEFRRLLADRPTIRLQVMNALAERVPA